MSLTRIPSGLPGIPPCPYCGAEAVSFDLELDSQTATLTCAGVAVVGHMADMFSGETRAVVQQHTYEASADQVLAAMGLPL